LSKALVFGVGENRHAYGGPDFAVIVDAKGRTHHKYFRELEMAGPWPANAWDVGCRAKSRNLPLDQSITVFDPRGTLGRATDRW
jgi:hypothetical protein